MHELLEDLGDAPTIDELLGTELTGDEAANEALRQEMAKTEISLTLSSKFEVQTDDKADMKSLLIRYGFKLLVLKFKIRSYLKTFLFITVGNRLM